MSTVKFTVTPSRDWDFLDIKGTPDGMKFDAGTRQALAKAEIYWSFKRGQYYKKSRIDPTVVKGILAKASFEPRKGTAGYVAPTKEVKATDLSKLTKAQLIAILTK
jgi:hypothetical protein